MCLLFVFAALSSYATILYRKFLKKASSSQLGLGLGLGLNLKSIFTIYRSEKSDPVSIFSENGTKRGWQDLQANVQVPALVVPHSLDVQSCEEIW